MNSDGRLYDKTPTCKQQEHIKMQAGNPTVIIDMNEWLYAHGESNVSFCLNKDMQLLVDIVYDDPIDDSPQRKRLIYEGVRSISVSGMPGVDLMDIGYSKGVIPDGRIVEYIKSDAADKWTNYVARLGGARIRHFLTCFAHVNLALVVFAEDCRME